MRESPGFDEDNTDSKEVLEDVVLRVTAREYLDTLRAVLTSGGGQPGGEESLESGGADKVADNEEDNRILLSRLENENYDIGQTVTGLGDAVLANPALSHPLTLTILAGLAWPDSPSSTKVKPSANDFNGTIIHNFRLQLWWTWCYRECLN